MQNLTIKMLMVSMIVSLLVATTVYAEPQITGATIDESKITIEGTSFGSHPDFSPNTPEILNVGWHDFENGKYEGIGVNLQAAPRDAANFSISSDNMNRSNSHYYLKKQYVNSEGGCFGLRDSGDFDIWYWTFWFYMSENNQSGKFSRLWGRSDVTDQDYFYVSSGGANYFFRGGSFGRPVQWSSLDSFVANRWSRVELIFDRPNHLVSAYIDGKLQWTHNDWLPTSFQANGQLWEVGGMLDGPSRDYFNPNGSYNFDNVFFDHTLARVEIGNASTWNECTYREIQLPVSWYDTTIQVKLNQGVFRTGDTAYLFVVDADGKVSNGYPITIGGGGGEPQDNPPSVSITSPTNGDTYSTSNGSVTISGNASDDNGISSITWSNNRGGSGTATNSSGDWSDWSINGIALQEGENVITVTATDTNNQTATDTITVTYTPSDMVQAWNANDQTNDNDWKDSSVTYCVRLLIEGAQITRSGNQIMLGFKGRSSGDYTIRKVSIAEKDPNGGEGDVIDSTWTKVTFDGKSTSAWDTDEVTVPAGQEKLSDPTNFTIEPGKDYYVTFKIVSPSVYLNPPSTYKELYFWTDDHASNIDWSGNGHTTTQDYHALSSIYILSSSNDFTPPTAPQNFSEE